MLLFDPFLVVSMILVLVITIGFTDPKAVFWAYVSAIGYIWYYVFKITAS